MDQLQKDVAKLVEADAKAEADAAETFFRVKDLAYDRQPTGIVFSMPADRQRAPQMTESWF